MSVKLLICGRRRPGQSLSTHRHHMKNVHGVMVLDYIAADPDHAPRTYVQNHAFDGWFAAGDPSQNPLALARDFITEIGFPDMPSVKASRETEFYLTHLKPDEPRMVDDATVFGMPVRETVVAGDEVAGGPIKIFVMMPKAEDRDAFNAEWARRVANAPVARNFRHSHCTPLVPAPVAGVDIFWLGDADVAAAFAEDYRAQVIAGMEADGLLAPNSTLVLLAQEYILFAGADASKMRA
jgi:hypothetical protein